MLLTNYEPMHFLNRMQSDLNDFFKLNGNKNLLSAFEGSDELFSAEWLPSVDISENGKQFTVTVDVPGVDPKAIEVAMENSTLSIKGERKEEKEEATDNRRVRECAYGSFERRFRMPDTADANRITAKNKNGVLTITIAKKKEAKPKLIEIKS